MVLYLRARVEHVRHGRRLPSLLHQWTETQCLSCSGWSPHSLWYAQLKNDDLPRLAFHRALEAVLESLAGSTAMPFIDTSTLEVIERLPGWYGRYFHSPSMTFAHYEFKRGSSIHEHFHPQEEVYEVVEGELELNIDGEKQVA